jgi:uncharacterized surface protein with fasciclin (FAS1) repeats
MVARFCQATPVEQNCVGSGLLHVVSATSGVWTATRLNGVTGKIRWLVVALKGAGLVETLKGKRPFTVFAPADAAFAKHAIRCRQSTMSATLQGLT